MLVFHNDGVIDMRGVTTFGVNAKDAARNPIGFFGTGIKFGIAVLLRNGCSITIYAGETCYTFRVRKDTVRGKAFDFIEMVCDVPHEPMITQLAFTTALGPNWKMWQAYREFYCNCVTDEGGTVSQVPDDFVVAPDSNATVVTITGAAFEAEHTNREAFIMDPERQPRFVVPGVIEVYDGSSTSIFYRGIRVGDMPEGGARYTYNILEHILLTEDRTIWLHSQFTGAVMQAVMSCTDEAFTEDVLTTIDSDGDRKGIETKLDFGEQTFTEKMFSIAKRVIEKTKKKMNASAYPGVLAYERENLISRRVDLTAEETKRLSAAIETCAFAGFPFTGTIAAVADLGAGITAVSRDDTVLLHIDLWRGKHDYASVDLTRTLAMELAQLKFGHVAPTKEFCERLMDHLLEVAKLPAGGVLLSSSKIDFGANVDLSAGGNEPELVIQAEDEAQTPGKVFVLVGRWSGYTSAQSGKIVHREIIDEDRKNYIGGLTGIGYTDGTRLDLEIVESTPGDTVGLTPILGYKNLIDEAAYCAKRDDLTFVQVDKMKKFTTQKEAAADELPPNPTPAPAPKADADTDMPF